MIDKINRAVEAVRKDEDWRNEYMTEYIYLQDIREEGREEGRVEERMTMSRTIVNNMISLGIAPEAIARLTKLSPEVIEEILMEQ